MRGAIEGLGGEASSEAEIVPRIRGGLGWAVKRSWAVCRVWIGLLWDLEGIWALLKSLEMFHGVRVRSDNGVVIIGGFSDFFLSRIAVE